MAAKQLNCYYCVIFVIFTFGIIIADSESTKNSLYTSDDPIFELNTANFTQFVPNKEYVSVVEFYNFWCGHCIRFAPLYKQFARDIAGWSDKVKVAAINCVDDDSTAACRQNEITLYPTIKIFFPHSREGSKGHKIEESRIKDPEALTDIVVNTISTRLADKDPSPDWSTLKPVRSSSLKSLISEVGSNHITFYLIVQPSGSFVGQKVILDMTNYKDVYILFVEENNTELIKDLQYPPVPSLLIVNQDGSVSVSLSGIPLAAARKKFVEYLGGKKHYQLGGNINDMSTKFTTEEIVTLSPSIIGDAIYLVDIENAVHSLLTKEVGGHSTIDGEKLQALKDFVSVLAKYLPGIPPVKRFLRKLKQFVISQESYLPMDKYFEILKAVTLKSFLPPMREWITCKGSQSRYRGYPCSLWITFHTLTVQAVRVYERNIKRGIQADDPKFVLQSIAKYIKHFFSCSECAEHFGQMAKTLDNEYNIPRDTVMWLWKAHNTVNKRLSKDITEDPQHPKLQFPSSKQCASCHLNDNSTEPTWNENEVFEFLRDFYGKKGIINTHATRKAKRSNKLANSYEISSLEEIADENSNASINVQMFNFNYFTGMDVSLCVSLYIVSGMLLIVVYFLFTIRRQRRKTQLVKVPFTYP